MLGKRKQVSLAHLLLNRDTLESRDCTPAEMHYRALDFSSHTVVWIQLRDFMSLSNCLYDQLGLPRVAKLHTSNHSFPLLLADLHTWRTNRGAQKELGASLNIHFISNQRIGCLEQLLLVRQDSQSTEKLKWEASSHFCIVDFHLFLSAGGAPIALNMERWISPYTCLLSCKVRVTACWKDRETIAAFSTLSSTEKWKKAIGSLWKCNSRLTQGNFSQARGLNFLPGNICRTFTHKNPQARKNTI